MNRNQTLKREAVIRRRKIQVGSREGADWSATGQIHHAPPRPRRPRLYLRIKRLLDVALAATMLVATLPAMLVVALLVRITSKGPAIYVQTRVGRGGATFRIFKIRTMVDNCESLTGPRWAMPGDPRVTPIGAILRATHLDELPQLWNVIRGDMAMIGPRPERPEIIENLVRDLPEYHERHDVRPGITGLAQVQLPPDTDLSSVADKLILDRAYIDRVGIWLDLKILVCTAMKLFGLGPTRCRFLVRSAIPTAFTIGANLPRPQARRAA